MFYKEIIKVLVNKCSLVDNHELLNYLIVYVLFRCYYENKPILLLSLIVKTWCEHLTWVCLMIVLKLICKYSFF